MQGQLDAAVYNTMLATLLEGGQAQISFSVVNDMRTQGLPVDATSCNHLIVHLMSANQLDAAAKAMQVFVILQP